MWKNVGMLASWFVARHKLCTFPNRCDYKIMYLFWIHFFWDEDPLEAISQSYIDRCKVWYVLPSSDSTCGITVLLFCVPPNTCAGEMLWSALAQCRATYSDVTQLIIGPRLGPKSTFVKAFHLCCFFSAQ